MLSIVFVLLALLVAMGLVLIYRLSKSSAVDTTECSKESIQVEDRIDHDEKINRVVSTVDHKSNSVTSLPRVPSESADLVVLHVVAKDGQYYQGYELLQALLRHGLRFGDRKIFHCYDAASSPRQLFSLTALNKPGTFDLSKMGQFKCRGLILFMQVDGCRGFESQAFDTMVKTAFSLVNDLGGSIVDECFQLVDQSRLSQIKAEKIVSAESVLI
jgi:cell division protein ZipA